MGALQLYYTSCRKGLSGGAGFQTRAASAGVSSDEQRLIERRGIYRPPRDLQAELDPGELQDLVHQMSERSPLEVFRLRFPKAFRSFALDSRRQAVLLSCYVGQDYSGRWGNYFTHALIVDDLAGHWPIDLYEWDGWKQALAEGEDTEESPPPLPAADLDAVVPSPSFAFEELAEFLREEPDHRRHLAAMLRAVMLRRETSRPLVIRDSEISGLYWIACIQKAFPAACQRHLGCSSYQFDPGSCLAVNATTGATDFLFNDEERRFQFFVFDFETGRHSEVPASAGDYPETAARWMAEEPAKLRDFHDFAQRFVDVGIGPEVSHLLRLFRLSLHEPEELTAAELASTLEFARRQARDESRPAVLAPVGLAARQLTAGGDAESHAVLIHHLGREAAATGEPAHRRWALEAWVRMFDDLVAGRHRDLDRLRQLEGELLGSLAGGDRELADLFVDRAHLDSLAPRFPGLDAGTFGELLRRVLVSLEVLGRRPAWEQPEVEGFLIEPLLSDPAGRFDLVEAVLAAFRGEAEAVATVVIHLADRLDRKAAGRKLTRGEARSLKTELGGVLGRVLRSDQAAPREPLLKQLDAPATYDVLLGEWEQHLLRIDEKEAAYRRYRRQVFPAKDGFAAACGAAVAEILLLQLEPERQAVQAIEWVGKRRLFDRHPKAFKERLVALAASGVPLDVKSRKARRLVEHLLDLVSRFGLARPPQLVLLDAVKRAGSVPQDFVRNRRKRLDTLHKALLDLGAASRSYGPFLGRFLQPVLEEVDHGEDHAKVVRAVLLPGAAHVFWELYQSFLRGKRLGDVFFAAEEAALYFWLGADIPDLRPYRSRALDLLAARIARNKLGRKAILQQIDAAVPGRFRRDWEVLRETIEPGGLRGRYRG